MAGQFWVSLSAIDREWNARRSLWRYGFVGILTNAGGYCLYLTVTGLGGSPKASMSILFFVGTLLGFIGNRNWAFQHKGKVWPSVLRYSLTYFLGYCLNFFMLYFFSDRLGYPHQLVQAVAMFFLVGFLFLMLKFFVFPRSAGARAD